MITREVKRLELKICIVGKELGSFEDKQIRGVIYVVGNEQLKMKEKQVCRIWKLRQGIIS